MDEITKQLEDYFVRVEEFITMQTEHNKATNAAIEGLNNRCNLQAETIKSLLAINDLLSARIEELEK